MPDRTAPTEGVTLTVPSGHPALTDIVDAADRATNVLADLVTVLRADPVDVLAACRLAKDLADLAEEFDLDADLVVSAWLS